MLETVNLLKSRYRAMNNDRQHNRMIQDKLKTFHRVLLYSYQAGWIKKDEEGSEWVRALINPDRVKFDYDEKIVSVDYHAGFKCGDTFEWPRNSGTHWIILKQEMTELAYFRANIRRCLELTAVDPETGEQFSQWCAVRGPVETKINTIQKAGIVADVPNLTLDIYMVNTEQNRRTFERYCNFEFAGRFWKVQAPDSISTPGVLEIVAEEDYDCRHDDLLVEVKDPNPPIPKNTNYIIGESFVKPLDTMIFTPKTAVEGWKWSVTLPAENNKEIDDVLEYNIKNTSIEVTWYATFSGSYILHYGPLEKTVVAESLF